MPTYLREEAVFLRRLPIVRLTLVFSSLVCQAAAQEGIHRAIQTRYSDRSSARSAAPDTMHLAQRGFFGRRHLVAPAPVAAPSPPVAAAPAPVAPAPAPKPMGKSAGYLAKLRRPTDLPELPERPQLEKRPKTGNSTTRAPRIPSQDMPDLTGSRWSSAAGGKIYLMQGGVLHHSCKYCTKRGTWEQHGKVVVRRIGKFTTVGLVEGNSMRCKNQLGNVWTAYRID